MQEGCKVSKSTPGSVYIAELIKSINMFVSELDLQIKHIESQSIRVCWPVD